MKTFGVLFMSLFIMPICFLVYHWGLDNQNGPGYASGSDVLRSTFSDETCTNPCWLGIEVGVSDRQVVETTLEEHNLPYSPNGPYTYNIFLERGASPLWQDVARPGADIHLSGDTVYLMTVSLDLCPSTIVDTYGYPQIATGGSYLDLLYPDYGLNFLLNTDSQRVDMAILYTLDYIDLHFPLSERQAWTNYEDLFYRPCIDSLSQNH